MAEHNMAIQGKGILNDSLNAQDDEEGTVPDTNMSDSEETPALNGDGTPNGTADKDDDMATASEDEDSASHKTNGTGSLTLPKKAPPKPLPTLKLSLGSKKLPTSKGMRIKLKLPTQANKGLPTNAAETSSAASTTPPEPTIRKTTTVVSKHATGMGSRRRPVVQSKQVRLPPIASPGLLLPGKPSAASVFDSNMANAGYTDELRATQPHRGSSVRRTVDDLFDTDIRLALHRIELVSPELGENAKHEKDGKKRPLADVLKERLQGRKRPRSATNTKTSIREMVPVSLTIPYPERYRQQYLNYLEEIDGREQTIVEWQETAEMIEDLGTNDPNPVVVPPIPKPPDPPKISELNGYSTNLSDQRHPLYPPTSEDGSVATRVAHLDPNCFHISNGRYFGLDANNMNDPQIFGPNAPGFSGSGGLATATTSTTTSTSGLSGGGMTVILSAGFHCAAAVPVKEYAVVPKPALLSSSSKLVAATPPIALPNAVPPNATTENANALRLVMMDNEWADKFRVTIWKAVVYACRTQKYDTPFVGPNGHVYPDLGRAFSAYGLVKPCLRCKNNKQGVYHCRVRRKHRDADFDGDNSVESLVQFQETPLDSLLETPLDSPGKK